jgi:acyl-CoA thioesterase-1
LKPTVDAGNSLNQDLTWPGLPDRSEAMTNAFRAFSIALAIMLAALTSAGAASIKIVAIGASNTSGWGVGTQAAYPARLEALLKARGINAQVTNAGVPFETTNGMLGRIDSAVPNGTQLVIIQPGGNDLRFLGSKERRTANINAMVAKLRARGIKTIVFDPQFPRDYYSWDQIHFTADAHGRIAQTLAPQVAAAIGGGRTAGSAQRTR